MNFKIKGKIINANTTGTGKHVITLLIPKENGKGSDALTVFVKSPMESSIDKEVEMKVSAFIKMAFEQ